MPFCGARLSAKRFIAGVGGNVPDTVGVIAQFPIRSLRLKTLRFLMRERRNAAATRGAFLLGEGLVHVLGRRITALRVKGDTAPVS